MKLRFDLKLKLGVIIDYHRSVMSYESLSGWVWSKVGVVGVEIGVCVVVRFLLELMHFSMQ